MGKEKKDEIKVKMAEIMEELKTRKVKAVEFETSAKLHRLAMKDLRTKRDELAKELLKGKIKELEAKVEA